MPKLERKCLIQPPEAYILLPDRLCNKNTDVTSQETVCLVDLLTRSIESQTASPSDRTRFVPVNWLQLTLEPHKMASVIAAIVPSLNGIRTNMKNHVILSKRPYRSNQQTRNNLVETFKCVTEWNCDHLINLQLIIVVPWPDPPIEVLADEYRFVHKNTPFVIRKSMNQSKQENFTMGLPLHQCEKFYFDLTASSDANQQVIILPDMFIDSSVEVAIALLTCLSRGVWKDGSTVFEKWIQQFTTSTKSHSNGSVCSPEYNPIMTGVTGYHHLSTKQPMRKISPCYPEASVGNNETSCTGRITQLKDTHLGLVGLSGDVARQIARIAGEGLRMQIKYYQPHPISNEPYEHCESLSQLLSTSDIIILADDTLNHVNQRRRQPPSPRKQLKHPPLWLNETHLRHCRPHCLFVCVTQIQCIDFTALTCALRQGRLLGAGLTMPNVWYTDRKSLDNLSQLPNTIILPPVSSSACVPHHLRAKLTNLILDLLLHKLPVRLEPQHDITNTVPIQLFDPTTWKLNETVNDSNNNNNNISVEMGHLLRIRSILFNRVVQFCRFLGLKTAQHSNEKTRASSMELFKRWIISSIRQHPTNTQ